MLPFKLIYSDDYYLPIGSTSFPPRSIAEFMTGCSKTGIAEAV